VDARGRVWPGRPPALSLLAPCTLAVVGRRCPYSNPSTFAPCARLLARSLMFSERVLESSHSFCHRPRWHSSGWPHSTPPGGRRTLRRVRAPCPKGAAPLPSRPPHSNKRQSAARRPPCAGRFGVSRAGACGALPFAAHPSPPCWRPHLNPVGLTLLHLEIRRPVGGRVLLASGNSRGGGGAAAPVGAGQ
jgi:hypothetical protein